MTILLEFIFRLSFGLALAMALTSPTHVTSGYYRNHLYVLLGLNSLAAMAAFSSGYFDMLTLAIAAAVLSYVGAVFWLYEAPRAGRIALVLVSFVALAGAYSTTAWPVEFSAAYAALRILDPPTSGLLLGCTLAAMFLGHWYLNTPTMQLAPLRRLVVVMAATVALRAAVCAVGLALEWRTTGLDGQILALVALRWLAGLVAPAILAVMTWQTLKIPNTQSATGILYVAVIVTFLGELSSLLVSSQSSVPL